MKQLINYFKELIPAWLFEKYKIKQLIGFFILGGLITLVVTMMIIWSFHSVLVANVSVLCIIIGLLNFGLFLIKND